MKFSIFESIPNIRYGFSERRDGNLRITAPTEDTTANRRRFLEREGLRFDRLVSADLVHGTQIHVAADADAGTVIPSCDGLVTVVPGLILSVTGADCFPIYAVDPKWRVIGVVHAGWRGLANGIVPQLIRQLRALGCDASDVLVGIGPGIRACHFEVKGDVTRAFDAYPEAIHTRDGRTFVDLPWIIKTQLSAEGVSEIEDAGECTFQLTSKYFSRRRDQDGPLEAMMAYLTFVQ